MNYKEMLNIIEAAKASFELFCNEKRNALGRGERFEWGPVACTERQEKILRLASACRGRLKIKREVEREYTSLIREEIERRIEEAGFARKRHRVVRKMLSKGNG